MAVKRALSSKEDYNLDQEVRRVYSLLVFRTNLIVSHDTVLVTSIHVNWIRNEILVNKKFDYYFI